MKKEESGSGCSVVIALALLAGLFYLFFKSFVDFFARHDVIQELRQCLVGLLGCSGMAIAFILLVIFVPRGWYFLVEQFQRSSVGRWLAEGERRRQQERFHQYVLQMQALVDSRRKEPLYLTPELLFRLARTSRYRTQNVVVGDPMGPDPHLSYQYKGPYYTPPYWEGVAGLMEDYIAYYNQQIQLESLSQGAVEQLVDDLMRRYYLIHPFEDGNKRLAVKLGDLAAVKYGYAIANPQRVMGFLGDWVCDSDTPGIAIALVRVDGGEAATWSS